MDFSPFLNIKDRDILLSTCESIRWWDKDEGLLDGAITLAALFLVGTCNHIKWIDRETLNATNK